MSLLSEYAKKEQQLKQLSEELKQLEGNEQLKREIAFKEKLEKLMGEYDKSAKDVLDLLEPERNSKASDSGQTKTGRRRRKLKVYKHPETGEIVETRGGNQKTLKAWKEEHGEAAVEGWVIDERE